MVYKPDEAFEEELEALVQASDDDESSESDETMEEAWWGGFFNLIPFIVYLLNKMNILILFTICRFYSNLLPVSEMEENISSMRIF